MAVSACAICSDIQWHQIPHEYLLRPSSGETFFSTSHTLQDIESSESKFIVFLRHQYRPHSSFCQGVRSSKNKPTFMSLNNFDHLNLLFGFNSGLLDHLITRKIKKEENVHFYLLSYW